MAVKRKTFEAFDREVQAVIDRRKPGQGRSLLINGEIPGIEFCVAELELLRAEQIARSRNDQIPPGERQIAHRSLTGLQLALNRLRAWV